ncbi:unnamed protein product [Paramecium octaurelia]|uniref:Uncharacterized protein n=1 Tax=Paramecium octaurelia TaxID=43137 RepID=A0A8S1XNH5_PAROT|nr:unnamed protein product [Paramecium octaurelia]
MTTQQKSTYNIMIIGNCNVGKTTIVQQLIDSNVYSTLTLGLDRRERQITINNQIITLYLWDMPDAKAFKSLIYDFKIKMDCWVIVYNSNHNEPIQTLDYWKNIFLTNDIDNVPIFVIQNIFDKNEIMKNQQVEQWCKWNRIQEFFQVSAKNDKEKVNQIFLAIAKILSTQNQEMMSNKKQVNDKINEFQKTILFENTIMKQQLKCKMQEQIELIQCQNQHDSPPIIVLLDENLVGFQRLICSKCLYEIRGRFNGINIDDAIQTIEERKNDYLDTISDFSHVILSKLHNFTVEIMSQKTSLLQTMDQLLNQISIWADEIVEFQQKQCSYKFFDEINKLNQSIEDIRNNQIDEFKKVIENINQNYETKIQITKQKFLSQLLGVQNTLEQLLFITSFKQQNSELKKINIDTKAYNQLNFKLVQEVKQNDWCHALAFNNTGTIMVACSNKNIKIWNFQQEGHEKLVKCIVFSKINNWFFSGSEDNTIRSWKEKQSWFSSSKWESVKPKKSHSNWVIQLILNEQENEMISCSVDKTIKIWRVQYDLNQIRLLQSLENHNQSVVSISLSQSEQQLISWSEDKQVILWEKNQQSQWQFKAIILSSIDEINRGARFLMDNQIICISFEGKLEIYNLQNCECQRQQVLIFNDQNLDQKSQEFSITFNIQTQLIVMKYYRYFYFFRNNLNDGQLEQVCQPLECQKEVSYFNVTNDGKYFIMWIWYPLLKFRVYELEYSKIQ